MQCEIKICCSGCVSDLVAPGFSPGHLGAVRRDPGTTTPAKPSPKKEVTKEEPTKAEDASKEATTEEAAETPKAEGDATKTPVKEEEKRGKNAV